MPTPANAHVEVCETCGDHVLWNRVIVRAARKTVGLYHGLERTGVIVTTSAPDLQAGERSDVLCAPCETAAHEFEPGEPVSRGAVPPDSDMAPCARCGVWRKNHEERQAARTRRRA